MKILGISAYYHDSAAALIDDGRIVAAAQEERFTRKRHDAGFPANAVAYCLSAGRTTIDAVDYLAFYDRPLLKFDRLFETYLAFAPRGFQTFKRSLPLWIKEKVFMKRNLLSQLHAVRGAQVVFPEHHESHGASAFFPSPFEEAAVLTMDGVGEWATTSFGLGKGNRLQLEGEIRFPHSIGLLYSAFTYYCGFKVNSGEYKLMGLAPYGEPKYKQLILDNLMELKPDGSVWLDMSYFNYCTGLTMTGEKFHALFGGPPRQPSERVQQRHMDIAASIQAVTEEVVLKAAAYVRQKYGCENLVMAGGVALNCVANGKLLKSGIFKNVWIQPAAGDAGGCLGAALFTYYHLLDNPRATSGRDSQQGSFLGPEHSDGEIRQVLQRLGVPFEAPDGEEALLERVSKALAEGKIVGWFQGRMEFGPRSLGARSILGDPRSADTQSVMNLKIKYRESFRPFAPVVLNEHKTEWFDLDEKHENPYMMIVAPVLEKHRRALSPDEMRRMKSDENLLSRVTVPRSSIPAVTHVDNSARVQTIGEEAIPRFRALLNRFYAKTGCPVLVNTSFNVRGEPIVCTPEDALRCFAATEMDVLVLGDCIVETPAKDKIIRPEDKAKHINNFELD